MDLSGRGTTDAIFIVRQLQEKYLAKNKELWMAFVDLEKAFDRVPREVVWWALRYLGVDEWIVSVIEPNVKLECVPKFCYFGDTLGQEEGWRK